MSKLLNDKETSLLKFCLYYDGIDKSIENELWASYEERWMHACIQTNDQTFQWDVKEMIHDGISEEWIDSFGIPRTLVGAYFNRYCHWVGMYDKNDFMKWFEIITTCAKIAQVQIEGKRTVKRNISYFNLNMIISVGYRVNSKRGVKFSQWANKVLKEEPMIYETGKDFPAVYLDCEYAAAIQEVVA